MKDLKIGASKKKLPTKLIGLIVGVITVVAIGYAAYVLVWNNSFDNTDVATVTEVKNKNTAYDGEGVNKNDAAAAEAYCEDTKERINIKGSSRIIDTCVAKSVSTEWLSKMTSEEIELMYTEQPSCIETGFDKEGYNCFTGYNEKGCNRGGQKEDGTYCEGSAPVTPIDLLSGYDSKEVCGLVASCQAESEFSPEGFNKFGCDRQGRNKDGEMCPYEHITRIYGGEGNYDQLGFAQDGFNKSNCDIRGYSRDGSKCAIEDVTRVYGIDKKDQYGFFEDGYNDKNCDIKGLNRQGEACDFADITRIFDPKTGLDQFALDVDGYNTKNCHFTGFNRQGELCKESDITRIVGKSGKDQRGIFANGQNEFGCLANGTKKNGEMCSIKEIANVFNPVTGKNSLGFYESGFNENGCSMSGFNASGELCDLSEITRVYDKKTKRDQFGLDKEGFNKFNCGVDGYRANGELCNYDEIPLIFDPETGLNQFGLDKDGFSPKGCSIDGFDKNGKRCEAKDIPRIFKKGSKYDQFGIGADGFNAANCNIKGLDRNGNVCGLDDIPRIFDPETGVDQFGLLPDGFTKQGCNLQGKRRDGTLCSLDETPRIFGTDGFDQNNLNKKGELKSINTTNTTNGKGKGDVVKSRTMNTANLDSDALQRLGFTDGSYNENGCDINGLSKQGEICGLEEITRVFDKDTGRDQFGLDSAGFNEFNCNLSGFKPDGTACPEDQITRIYDKNNKDQFGKDASENPVIGAIHKAKNLSSSLSAEAKKALGLNSEGFSIATGCDLTGVRRDGTLCDFKDIPKVFDPETGRDQFGFDARGFNEFNCNVDGKKPDGSPCKAEEITELMDAFGKNQFGKTVSGIPKNNPLYNYNGEVANTIADKIKRLADTNRLDKDGFSEGTGCNLAGLKKDGSLCDFKDIPKVFDLETGRDQFGFDSQGFNKFNCDINGKKPDGSTCKREEVTELMDASGKNQFGQKVNGVPKNNPLYDKKDGVSFEEKLRRLTASQRLDKDGFSEVTGCNVAGVRRDGTLCDFKDIPKIYDPETGRDQFGFDARGFNKFKCDIDGKKPDGSACAPSEITELVDGFGKNQFGRTVTGVPKNNTLYNGASSNSGSADMLKKASTAKRLDKDGFSVVTGCNLAGLRRDGTLCNFQDIPKFFDPETGRDQFGFDSRGFNKFNCDIDGKKPDGSACKSEDITELMDASGKNQFGKKVNGLPKNNPLHANEGSASLEEKLKQLAASQQLDKDGFSVVTGCNLAGLKKDGSLCDFKDIPKVFDLDTGRDQFGFDQMGFNEFNCNIKGQRPDGSYCRSEDITELMDAFGKNQFGKKVNGIPKNNPLYANEGSVSLEEKLKQLTASQQLDKDGFSVVTGCNLAGLKKDGSLCDFKDIPKVFDLDTGRDQFGFDAQGFNKFNCDIDGKKPDGSACKSDEITELVDGFGKNQFGQRVNGTPKNNPLYDNKDGISFEEKLRRLTASQRLDKDGFSEATGCNVAGVKRDGSLCEFKDIPKVFDPETGRDQFGFDTRGFNKFNCDIDGKKPDGSACKADEITELLDGSGKNQFGQKVNGTPKNNPLYDNKDGISFEEKLRRLTASQRLDKDGFSEATGCNVAGVKRDGSLCEFKDIPKVFDPETGRDQFGFDTRGFNKFNCDIDGKKPDGSTCKADEITELVDGFGKNQFGQRVNGTPKNNPFYNGESAVSGDFVDKIRQIAESKAKLDSSNIKNKAALNSLTSSKAKELGLDDALFNIKGCGIDGLDRNGNVCDIKDIPRLYDPVTNLDQFGFSKSGFNSAGCDFYGFKADGSKCDDKDITKIVGKNGQTQFTSPLVSDLNTVLNSTQQSAMSKIKAKGGLANLRALDSLTPQLMKELGLDQNLRNRKGCGLDGLREDGTMCDIKDIPRVYDPSTGLDQFGINRAGFNTFGCDLSGKRADGSICPPNQVSRIFDKENKDQFGKTLAAEDSLRKALSKLSGNVKNIDALTNLSEDEIKRLGLDENFRNAKGCGLDGLREDGSLCALEDIPRVFDPKTGLDQFGLTRGNRNKFGCDLNGRKADGTVCLESEVTKLLDVNNVDSAGRKMATLSDAKSYLANKPKNITNPSVFEFLNDKKIAELGLDENFRNAKGCGLDGLRADGSICELKDIPRVFDPETGLDQFGLTADNRNIWGCNIEGFDRNGNRCDEEKITRIFGADGFDQRGLDESNLNASGLTLDGRNRYGCDIAGKKENGAECQAWEKIEAFGVDGYNSANINRDGEDRLKLINGRNSYGCDINGLREDGSLCPLDEITRFFKEDGTDQFGLRRNNRNEFGCDLQGKREDGSLCELENIPRIFDGNGIDQLGLTAEGYTNKECSIDGLRPDGTICSLNEIPRLIGADGFDQFGIGSDGFNAKNCNLQGLNRNGERCALEDIPMIFGANGLSQLGITRDGFAANGCSINGLNRQGLRCDVKDVPRFYNAKGEDQFGVFADGYNAEDCNISGFNRDGALCAQKDIPRIIVDGVDQLNFGTDGFNSETGCNLENKDKFGNSCHPKFAVKIIGANGVDQFGLIDGYNQYGCDLEGRKKDGTLCKLSEVTSVLNTTTGKNQFGIDPKTGLNEKGCNVEGKREDGSLCEPQDIPRLTDSNGVDQFGLDPDGFSVKTGCNLLGFDKAGKQCKPNDVPFIFGDDGLSHLGVNAQGKTPDGYNILGLDEFGCDRDNMTLSGKHCAKYLDLNIDVADTQRLEELRKLQKQTYDLYAGVKSTDIGQGSISASEIVYDSPEKNRQLEGDVIPNAAVLPVGRGQLANGAEDVANNIIEIPEGTTMHVYVETPVDTDYTTTIWGEIVGGELDGARVRGTIEVPYINDPVMPRDKFKYVFTSMIRDRKTYSINAVSMTFEDLGEFVEADSVDYHRFQRYGGLLTAAAFQALGSTYLDSAEERALAQQSALTQQATETLLGQNTRANAKTNIKVATDQIADLAKQNFFRRPTIKKSATDLMIIFMEPIDNDELPAVFMDIR